MLQLLITHSPDLLCSSHDLTTEFVSLSLNCISGSTTQSFAHCGEVCVCICVCVYVYICMCVYMYVVYVYVCVSSCPLSLSLSLSVCLSVCRCFSTCPSFCCLSLSLFFVAAEGAGERRRAKGIVYGDFRECGSMCGEGARREARPGETCCAGQFAVPGEHDPERCIAVSGVR